MKAKLNKKSREEIVDPHTAIYHFKIYIFNIYPMIYRRFKIKGDLHFTQLHHLIQIIMGGVHTQNSIASDTLKLKV